MPPNYDRNVFINCPFDAANRPLFEPVTFAVYDCGFYPRSALEVEDSTQVRIEKIQTIIRESRLAVHDISRTELDRITCLPRFNMPLELGIFLGAKAFGSREQKRKAAIVLDTQPFRYQKYISDIAGQDIGPTLPSLPRPCARCGISSRPSARKEPSFEAGTSLPSGTTASAASCLRCAKRCTSTPTS